MKDKIVVTMRGGQDLVRDFDGDGLSMGVHHPFLVITQEKEQTWIPLADIEWVTFFSDRMPWRPYYPEGWPR